MRQEVAAQILLARYHYRRMPLRILLPHLWRKSQARRRAASQDAVAAAAAARG